MHFVWEELCGFSSRYRQETLATQIKIRKACDHALRLVQTVFRFAERSGESQSRRNQGVHNTP